jgi:hypothetical protein
MPAFENDDLDFSKTFIELSAKAALRSFFSEVGLYSPRLRLECQLS